VEFGGKDPVGERFQISDRKTISNWGMGGFAMGIIKGTATLKDAVLPVYGIAELLI
jgi:hypothetical protein